MTDPDATGQTPSQEITAEDLDTASLLILAGEDGRVRLWTHPDIPKDAHAVGIRALADRVQGVRTVTFAVQPCGVVALHTAHVYDYDGPQLWCEGN